MFLNRKSSLLPPKTLGELCTPTVHNSDLPGLLGLTALRNNKAIIDFDNLRLHFLGPGDSTLERSLPPGSETFQLEVAPSGHIVLPCCEFESPSAGRARREHTLTLLAGAVTGRGSTLADPASQRIPPPPNRPPNLPSAVRYQETAPPLVPPS